MYVFAEEEFISAFEVEFITNPRQQNKKSSKRCGTPSTHSIIKNNPCNIFSSFKLVFLLVARVSMQPTRSSSSNGYGPLSRFQNPQAGILSFSSSSGGALSNSPDNQLNKGGRSCPSGSFVLGSLNSSKKGCPSACNAEIRRLGL